MRIGARSYKKVPGNREEGSFNKVRQEAKYKTIREFNEAKEYKVRVLCEILSIPHSSYYKWLKRTETSDEILNKEITNLIIKLHDKHKGILGYRQMTLWINKELGSNYNIKPIRRLMKLVGVSSLIRRKRKGYKKHIPEQVGENILNREFKAEKPNEKWLTYVTEFKVSGTTTKLYLSAIIDLFDNSVVAHKLGTSNNNPLVFETYDLAILNNPDAKPIFHSDRGYQYTSRTFKHKLDIQGSIQSMSRVGRCIDNGPMEGFFGIIKSEMYYLNKYNDIEVLKNDIDNYINFYNNGRYQTKLKGLSPIEYRKQA
ncbi:TPA: IS3 family transposase [bacterium]|nr:IS3 family transposase [bacterium]